MLRACRRLLRRAGRTAFTVIELAPDLDPAQRRIARAAAPLAVASRRPYDLLLASAGFVDVQVRDVTDQYRRTAAALRDEYRQHRDALIEAVGEAYVAERIQTWSGALEVIDAGLLRRRLYLATRG